MFVGIDHSTTGIKVVALDDHRPVTAFQIDRRELERVDTVLSLLDEQIDIADINLATITYSYGNGISTIENIDTVSDRGVKDLLGLGYETGAGAKVFDQFQASSVPTVVLPGIHRGLPSLHPYFRHYSTLAGADKVASIRYAHERFCDTFDPSGTFIWACASSSCMAGLVCEGRIKGFFHWVGPVHGWPDPEAIRRGLEGDFDDIFMQSGLLPRSGQSLRDAHDMSDPELFELVYWATIHNIYSLYPFAEELGTGTLDAVVLSGRLMRRGEPIELGRRLYERCLTLAPVLQSEPYASAHGAALVARDVIDNAEHVLGIPVGDVPSR